MDMTLKYYNQPHITVEEQIQLLKSEGLSFENESRAKHLLNHISMFRLKSCQGVKVVKLLFKHIEIFYLRLVLQPKNEE